MADTNLVKIALYRIIFDSIRPIKSMSMDGLSMEQFRAIAIIKQALARLDEIEDL